MKQPIIKTVVDKILINVNENWFKIEGLFPGKFRLRPVIDQSIENVDSHVEQSEKQNPQSDENVIDIVSNPVDRDS